MISEPLYTLAGLTFCPSFSEATWPHPTAVQAASNFMNSYSTIRSMPALVALKTISSFRPA